MTILRLAAGLVGLLLIGSSYFLYEPEELHVKRIITRWGYRMDGQKRRWLQRNEALLRDVGAQLEAALNSIFGVRLFSLRAILVVINFALASFLLLSFAFSVYTWTSESPRPIPPVRAVGFLFLGAFMLYGALSRAPKYDELNRAAVALVGGSCVALFLGATSGHVGGFIVGFAVGAACGYGVISGTRLLAAWSVATTQRYLVILLALANAILGVGLLVAPILVMNTGKIRGLTADVLGFGALSNAVAGVIAMSFAILPVTLLLQAIVWPMFHRPLHALARFDVFKKRGILFGAGAILTVFAVPQTSGFIQSIVALIK